MTKLDAQQIADSLERLPRWRHDAARGAIVRQFLFADFAQAFAFMTQLALMAEKSNHHPEWSNAFNRVDVALTTHDVGGISERDVDFATYAEQVYRRFAGA
jgi:4a-hydroxytetrahydrobiopterin dehydratase